MRKFIAVILLALTALLSSACTSNTTSATIRGSGRLVTEQRSATGVVEVSLNTSGNLTVELGDSEGLLITAEDNIMPMLTSDVSAGQLSLGTKPNSSFNATRPISYRLTVKNLRGLSLAGSGDASAMVRAEQFKVFSAGSGNITVSGVTGSQDVSLTGSGDYRASSLQSKTAKVSIMGSGAAFLNASDALEVTIMGSGDVNYTGTPSIHQNIGGSGRVKKQ